MSFAVARAGKACVALLLCLGAFARAQPAATLIDPQGELSLAQALQAALQGNPDLRTSAYELSASQARRVQAGLRPNPQLDVEFENFTGSDDYRGVDGLDTTLTLSQVVELGGKRVLRNSAAQADIDAVSAAQRSRELDVLAEVTRRFLDVVVAQERSEFAAEAQQLTQQTLDAIAVRVDAGRSPEAERTRARIALLRAQVEHQQAQSALRSARYALTVLWGNPEPGFRSARANLFQLQRMESVQALARRLDSTPDLLLWASEGRLREAQLRLAQAQARPDLTLSVGARQMQASSDVALVAGFSMALPWSDRNQGAIREAQVRVTQSQAQLDAARLKARATLLALHQQMTTAQQRVQLLRSEALPLAEQALDQTRAGFQRGRFSFLELATAQEELLTLRAALIDAAADYHRMLAELERLTSAALAGAVN